MFVLTEALIRDDYKQFTVFDSMDFTEQTISYKELADIVRRNPRIEIRGLILRDGRIVEVDTRVMHEYSIQGQKVYRQRHKTCGMFKVFYTKCSISKDYCNIVIYERGKYDSVVRLSNIPIKEQLYHLFNTEVGSVSTLNYKNNTIYWVALMFNDKYERRTFVKDFLYKDSAFYSSDWYDDNTNKGVRGMKGVDIYRNTITDDVLTDGDKTYIKLQRFM